MKIEIKVDTSKFDCIAGVPHPKTGKPIRVRRVVVTGKTVPEALDRAGSITQGNGRALQGVKVQG